MTGVLVVDDHPVFRRGIVTLLDASGFDIVGEAAGAEEAVTLAERLRPEVIVMDLGLPDDSGVTATARITGMLPETRVVVVTMFDDDGTVRAALAAGASGYVVKDARPEEIVAAVRAAALGAVLLGSGVHIGAAASLDNGPAADVFGFTPRESDVAALLAKGLTNRQIAERLGIAGKTVSNLVSTVLHKLGVADRVEAAMILRQ